MKKIYAFLFLLIAITSTHAQPVIGYQSVATGFTAPVDVVNAGDDPSDFAVHQHDADRTALPSSKRLGVAINNTAA